jgi:hypothetical protein
MSELTDFCARGAGLFTVAAPAAVYDAAPLVDVWR